MKLTEDGYEVFDETVYENKQLRDMIKSLLIGRTAEADHPITCLNPTKTFIIKEVAIKHNSFSVRGENTCWFNKEMIKLY